MNWEKNKTNISGDLFRINKNQFLILKQDLWRKQVHKCSEIIETRALIIELSHVVSPRVETRERQRKVTFENAELEIAENISFKATTSRNKA